MGSSSFSQLKTKNGISFQWKNKWLYNLFVIDLPFPTLLSEPYLNILHWEEVCYKG